MTRQGWEQEKWGFGCPGGEPAPVRTYVITPRDWYQNRIAFHRPTLLVPEIDLDAVLYIYECNTAPEYCAGSANQLFQCRKFRRGQTAFLNRPGRYSFYLDHPATSLPLAAYDWASLWNDDPNAKYLTGYDPTLPGFRGIGCAPGYGDPAPLWTSDPALNALVGVLLNSVTGWTSGTIICLIPGTAVAGSSFGGVAAGKQFVIKAPASNAGYVYLGESAAIAQAHGLPLAPGEAIQLAITNIDLVYCDADNAGEGVAWYVES
jgi:hypothetical protein